MGKLVISTNASLDGVVQDPDGAEGFGFGGWFAPVGSRERDEWAEVETDEALRAHALLLGRRSYHYFETRWSSRDGVWADRLNTLPKYVVSSTLSDGSAAWGPTTVLRGEVADEVSELKRTLEGDIVVYASYRLGHALMDNDLVDEIRLFVHPWVLGAGARLFGDTARRKPLRLASSRTLGDGLVLLTYDVIGRRSRPPAAADVGRNNRS